MYRSYNVVSIFAQTFHDIRDIMIRRCAMNNPRCSGETLFLLNLYRFLKHIGHFEMNAIIVCNNLYL